MHRILFIPILWLLGVAAAYAADEECATATLAPKGQDVSYPTGRLIGPYELHSTDACSNRVLLDRGERFGKDKAFCYVTAVKHGCDAPREGDEPPANCSYVNNWVEVSTTGDGMSPMPVWLLKVTAPSEPDQTQPPQPGEPAVLRGVAYCFFPESNRPADRDPHLTALVVPVERSHPYFGLSPVVLEYPLEERGGGIVAADPTGNDNPKELIRVLRLYAKKLCEDADLDDVPNPMLFYSPKIGWFSFATDPGNEDRFASAKGAGNSGLGYRGDLETVSISHVRCKPS